MASQRLDLKPDSQDEKSSVSVEDGGSEAAVTALGLSGIGQTNLPATRLRSSGASSSTQVSGVMQAIMKSQLNFQIEENEWTRINKELRQHGLPAVELVHPAKAGKLSDLVLLETETAKSVRESLLHLMKDCDRRQELIQELIATNNQLRDELKQQTLATERCEDKAKDLRMMLMSSKSQLEEVEEGRHNSSLLQDEEEKLRNTKNALQAKYKQLQQKCTFQEDEIDRLKKKVRRMIDEDERRLKRHNEVFQQLRKSNKTGANMDYKLVDVVDSYERQIHTLKKEVEEFRSGKGPNDEPKHDTSFDLEEATPNFKGLIKSYEKQLKESKKKIKGLESENEIFKLELEGRPELKDLRSAQHKVRKLERLIKAQGISTEGERDVIDDQRKYSTKVDDLEFYPASHCRNHLKQICDEVGVYDLENVVPKLQRMSKAVEAHPKLEQFAKDIVNTVDSEGALRPPEYRHYAPSHHPHQVWCEKSWHHVIPTVQYWLVQLRALKELQESLNKLGQVLLPWRSSKLCEGEATTIRLIEVVDSLIYEETAEPDATELKKKEQPPRAVLQGIVEHFQKLFDVPKVTGVYIRMNEVYTKLGEVHNVLKTLRDLLGLETDAKSSVIVDAVAQVCHSRNNSTTQQLKHLLQVEELDSVVQKLREHEEFFPVFQEIMRKLMIILNVSRMDQVIPAVRAIKLLAEES